MPEETYGYVHVLISEDSMQARLCLATTPSPGEASTKAVLFNRENVLQALSAAGVKAGINNRDLDDMISSRQFDVFKVIAQGKPPLNGVSGSFKYHFNTEHNNRPKILEDGSVDYHTLDGYEPVNKGDLIATYTPATSGHFGFNIRGGVIPNVKGKELPHHSGTGFHISEDGTQYYADTDGKVEIDSGSSLVVSNVFEVKGDVDLTTGDVVFNGDVIIYGSVTTGLRIEATGNVSINGNVEGAFITCGGDVTLKLGMQGGGRGVIKCGGSLFGKFFEQVKIDVAGDLHASSMMNCEVNCTGSMFITGRHGILVGGTTSCQGDLEATILGNLAEVRTNINVGITQENINLMNSLGRSLVEIQGKIAKHRELINKLNAINKPSNADELDNMKKQVENSLSELNRQCDETNGELEKLKLDLAAFSNSKIKVHKYLYPNVHINISGANYQVTAAFVNLIVKNVSGEIKLFNET